MVFKKTALLLLLLLSLLSVYAEEDEEEDVKVPVKLNNRLKGMQKFNPPFSKRPDLQNVNRARDGKDDKSDNPGNEPSEKPEVKTVTPPQPKTILDRKSDDDPNASKLADAVKIEVSENKPVDQNMKIKLDFKEEDLINIVKLFSELMQKNFIIPENLGKAKVNMMAPQMVTVREAYKTFLTLLAVNDFSVSEDGKFTIITREKNIPEMKIPFYKGTEVPDLFKMVATIMKFQYVDASEMDKVLKLFRDKGATSLVFDDKTLIVIDYAANIRKITTLIKELDQPSESDSAKLYFVKLQHVLAADARKIIDDIFKDFAKKTGKKSKSTASTPSISGVANPKRLPGGPNTAEQISDDEGISGDNLYLHIVADERSQQLIVLCNQTTYGLILQIVQNIDREVEGEGEIHVVKLQNAKAEDLVKTLNQLSKNKKATGAKSSAKGTDVFEGEVQISSNESTNSLVVVSSMQDFRNLKKVIEKLDIRRKQVFVEAAILEVKIDDSLEYGNAYTAGGFQIDVAGEKIPLFFGKTLDSKMSPGTVAGLVGPAIGGTDGIPGLGLMGGIPSIGIILNAAQNDSSVNVMSTPHLLTTDNEEAEISVGETIPFPSGNIISGTAGNTVTYTREDVALKLKIKPQINESGYMTLEVNQEVTELGAPTQYGFSTTKRQAKTKINAENEQTIVIGGLMKDSVTEAENKVPILGDIPVLGALFKYKRKVKAKVNLLIILTPHIVESKEDFARILKRKMDERDEFARKFYGDHVSFEDNIYLDKKRGALLTVVKTVNDQNKKEEEELLRLKSKKDERSIMVTHEDNKEVIIDADDREDILVPESVPVFDGE